MRNYQYFRGVAGLFSLYRYPKAPFIGFKMKKGARIPAHTHPADEYVYVLSGRLVTGSRECEKGCFWFTPGGTRQGPHVAETDVEIITMRLGPMGEFDGQ